MLECKKTFRLSFDIWQDQQVSGKKMWFMNTCLRLIYGPNALQVF